jgi:ribosomal protein S18 acetylase RimI-like enzyme
MNIRKITLIDVNKLAVLFDNYRIFYKMESNINDSEKFLADRIQNKESEIFVAENENFEFTGFVQLYPIFSSTRMKKLWLLNDLYIDENFRGKGISELLMNEAKKLCKETNACGLMLETAKNNEIGNNLYKKTGFDLDNEHYYYSWENK